jgi:hypothetical protein
MSGLPDSGWLRALELRTSTFAAVALACATTIALAVLDVPYLSAVSPMVFGIVGVVGLLAITLFLSRMCELGHERWREHRRQQAILAQLDKLSTSEEAFLRSQLEKNEQTFHARIDDRVAAGLRSKELALGSFPAHLVAWSHTIPDFVWAEMRRRWKVEEKSGVQPEAACRARAGLTGRGGG